MWTFPVLMGASIVIGWAAEVTAVRLSAGVALAVLAWLQTAPEFAVEATIAWHRNVHLALANLTGSLRLLLGLGWPGVFFIHWATRKRSRAKKTQSKFPVITLPKSFRVESLGLGFPVAYFTFVYLKGTWTLYDGVALCSFYLVYVVLLSRQKSDDSGTLEHADDEEFVVRKVLALKPARQYLAMAAMFVTGGLALVFSVHPFLEALKAGAVSLGVNDFVFVQWIAPIASELPEKVTAFGWARKPRKVPMAIVNMLSSVTSQWTLLAGLVPILFSVSAGHPFTIVFDGFQRGELLLTIAQSALTVVIIADLKIEAYEMVGFFVLWVVQFFMPSSRHLLVPVYFGWAAIELARLAGAQFFRRLKR